MPMDSELVETSVISNQRRLTLQAQIKKDVAIKNFAEAQKNLELGMKTLCEINPIVKNTLVYDQAQKLHLNIRTLISNTSGLKIS